MNKTTLYGKGSSGKIQVWSISYAGNEIKREYGAIDGKKQIKCEEVICGLGGRSIQEQIKLQVKSKIKNKIDGGYCSTLEEAENFERTNSLGLSRPMLAKTYSEKTKINESFFTQMKYNGHRCLITKLNNKIIAYSKRGNLITTIDHIIDSIAIKEGETIDGELYIHGMRLQDISSLVKKIQPKTKQLMFICYDYISHRPYWFRYNKIRKMELGLNAVVAQTTANVMGKDIDKLMNKAICEGYEGLMIRKGDCGYEDGRRSWGLLKVKEFIDGEFEVVNITASKDGIAILHFLYEGKPFKATAPGTVMEKIYTYDHSENFLGKLVTIEYPELTKAGIPFQPIAKCFFQDI